MGKDRDSIFTLHPSHRQSHGQGQNQPRSPSMPSRVAWDATPESGSASIKNEVAPKSGPTSFRGKKGNASQKSGIRITNVPGLAPAARTGWSELGHELG